MIERRFKIVVRSFLDINYHHVIGESLSEAKAEKVEEGLLMTMDMGRYYVETIEVKGEPVDCDCPGLRCKHD